MSLESDGLATAIKDKMSKIPAADADKPGDQNAGIEAMAAAIIEYIVDNLEVKISIGGVITSVTGGSGAPAIGIKNIAPISCEVK